MKDYDAPAEDETALRSFISEDDGDSLDLISAAHDAVTAWLERQGSPPSRFVDAMLALERVLAHRAPTGANEPAEQRDIRAIGTPPSTTSQ